MRPVLLGLALLAASSATHANIIWHLMPNQAIALQTFDYDTGDPGLGIVPITSNIYFNYEGTTEYADPVLRPDGLWESQYVDYDYTYRDFFGNYFQGTQTGTGSALFDPTRSSPDLGFNPEQRVIGATDPAFTNVFLDSPFPAFTALNFTLFNADGWRDPGDLPVVPEVDLFIQSLDDHYGFGSRSMAEWQAAGLTDPDLPSDWTGYNVFTFSATQEATVTLDFLNALTFLTFGNILDPAGLVDATDNGDGTYTLDLDYTGIFGFYTTDPFSDAQEELPEPGTIVNPLLPNNDPNCVAGFCFDFAIGSPEQQVFIDPAIATGYTYEITGDGFFTSVLLPDIGDGLFDLYFYDDGLGDYVDSGIDLTAGLTHNFGADVNRFRIGGIELAAGLDPNDPLAFVTGLTFDRVGRINVTQTAVTTFVPEPGVLALLAAGLFGVWRGRRPREITRGVS
ncbi:MAG: PEP-CTERM sorting domain-containing protein [Gammaproteobacteria bacterium]